MNVKPSENLKLYGMSSFFNEFKNLYDNKKLPNKILLSGKKGLGKSTLAYHIINYILSFDEDYKYNVNNFTINTENKSFRLIQNKSHPNFYLIDLMLEKKTIDISQIREMIYYTNKSSFNNLPRFILIDNTENLNKNSVNALLKIIEEPNQNLFFILINNNEKKILPTLKSRCLDFKINFTFEESINIVNSIINKNVLDIIGPDLINYYLTPGRIINLIMFSKEKKIDLKSLNLDDLLTLLIDGGHYKKNKVVKNMTIDLIELFFLKKYQLTTKKSLLIDLYFYFINKIGDTDKFNLDEESLFLEFKAKLLNG